MLLESHKESDVVRRSLLKLFPQALRPLLGYQDRLLVGITLIVCRLIVVTIQTLRRWLHDLSSPDLARHCGSSATSEVTRRKS